MPYLKLVTNVPESKIPPNFDVYLTDVIHRLLSKPRDYCCVHIMPGQILNFGGSHEPSALVTFMTVGRFSEFGNVHYSEVITRELEQHLHIRPHQTYIHFVDPKLSDISHNQLD